jgi:L-asparagine transporter-like permease
VLETIGLPAAATVMDIVVLTSVLSCLNSGLYTASRMAYSLSQRDEAPAAWRRLSARGVPFTAVLVSTVIGFGTVVLNYLWPDTVFLFLVNSSGAIAVFVWLVIAVSQLRMRRILQAEAPERLTLKMWGYPYLTWAAIVGMAALLVGMLFDEAGRPQLLLSLLVAGLVLAVAVVRDRRAATTRAEIHPPVTPTTHASAGVPERQEAP